MRAIAANPATTLTAVRISLAPTLKASSAVVETAPNGNKAVELVEANLPDLMVLDMMLPGRSGFLVLEKIKKRKLTDKPAVIMITGNTGSRHKMFADTYGVNEYFTKPVKMDKLVTTAERLLGTTEGQASGRGRFGDLYLALLRLFDRTGKATFDVRMWQTKVMIAVSEELNREEPDTGRAHA